MNAWSIPSPLRSSASMKTCCGFFMYFSASLRISAGIVAENKDAILSSGTRSRINFISSINPMSSIVSASSSTRYFMSFNSIEPRFR